MGLIDALQARAAEVRQRKLMEDIQAENLAQRTLAAQQQGQNAQSLKPLLSRFGAETAGQVGPLLASNDPQLQQQGGQILQGLLAQLPGPQRDAVQAALQSQVLQNTATAQGITQAGQMGPLQAIAARNNITLQDQQIAAGKLAANPPAPTQAQADAQLWQQQNGAAIPAGMRPQRRFARDQQGQTVQFIDVQPVEGTKPYTDAETALRTQERIVENLNSFLDTMATTGTEFRGKDALRLSQLRSRIIADYAALQNLGVLQPGEIKNLSEILPDPTGFTNQFNPWAAENIGAVYEQLLQQQEAKTMDLRQQFWFINPKPLMPGE